MTFYAHSGTRGDKSVAFRAHLLAVAAMAAGFARPFGLDKAAFAAGLFHDLGNTIRPSSAVWRAWRPPPVIGGIAR